MTQLKGKLPSALREESRDRAAESAATARRPRSVARGEDTDPCYFYDEWDELIGDYRSRWCRLYERELPGDGGEFFTRTVAANVRLIPEVRRQFQRIRPAMYRPLSGLEDGEDFDLNILVVSEIQLSPRLKQRFIDQRLPVDQFAVPQVGQGR